MDAVRLTRTIAALDAALMRVDEARAVEAPTLFGRRATVDRVRGAFEDAARSARDASDALGGLEVAGAADAKAAVDELLRMADQLGGARRVLTLRNDAGMRDAQAAARGVLALVRGVDAGEVVALDRAAAERLVAGIALDTDDLVTPERMRTITDLELLPEATRPELPGPASLRGRTSWTQVPVTGIAAGGERHALRRAELDVLRAWALDEAGLGDTIVASRITSGGNVDPAAVGTFATLGADRLEELGIGSDVLLARARAMLDGFERRPSQEQVGILDAVRDVLGTVDAAGPEQALVDRASLNLLRTSQRIRGRQPVESLDAAGTKQIYGHHFPDFAEVGRAGADMDLLLSIRSSRLAPATTAPTDASTLSW